MTEQGERWGSWEDAEIWREEAFLARRPEQRLRWLESALELAYASGAISLPTERDARLPPRWRKRDR